MRDNSMDQVDAKLEKLKRSLGGDLSYTKDVETSKCEWKVTLCLSRALLQGETAKDKNIWNAHCRRWGFSEDDRLGVFHVQLY